MIVKKAEYVADNKIKLLFSDGVWKVVDFTQFLTRTRKLIRPLLDVEYFKQFFVDEITICWPNGLDFAPELLYKIGEDVQPEKKTSKSASRSKPIRQRKKSGEKSQFKYQSTAIAKRISKKPKI